MKVKLVTIRDSKTQLFGSVTQVRNVSEAERSFEDLLSDEQSLMGKHKSDFDLYCVGEFDLETGDIVPCLVCVSRGSDYVK